ncbi:MAG: hypothetical protein JW940_33235 [Polyangiaceae bacterium]|nr:hypothetical protein [Polyangiaceae bacterium]
MRFFANSVGWCAGLALVGLVGCGADGSSSDSLGGSSVHGSEQALSTSGQAAGPGRAAADSEASGLPSGYVVTPYGLVHESCITEVSPGDTVELEDSRPAHLRRARGESKRIPRCQHPRLDSQGRALTAMEVGGLNRTVAASEHVRQAVPRSTPPPAVGPHAATAEISVPAGTSGLSSTWNVPGNGASSGGPVYLWPGLEDPSPSSMVLQPVLAWKYDTSARARQWRLENWYGVDSTYVKSATTIQVYTGDTITGTVTGSDCNESTGICSSWTVSSQDVTRGTSPTPVTLTGVSKRMTRVFGGVTEVWNISSCSQLPSGPMMNLQTSYRTMGGSWKTGSYDIRQFTQSPWCYYDIWNASNSSWTSVFLGFWNGASDYALSFDTSDSRRYTGLGDWAYWQYKAECDTAELVTGLSGNPSNGRAHSVLCSYDGQVNSKLLRPSWSVAGSFANGDWRRDLSTGDWDWGYFKGECASDEAVTGISQTTDGKLATLLCTRMWTETVAGACTTRVFSSGDSMGTSQTLGAGVDWAYGYYKGQCNSPGEVVKGVSRHTQTGGIHAILCCPTGIVD